MVHLPSEVTKAAADGASMGQQWTGIFIGPVCFMHGWLANAQLFGSELALAGLRTVPEHMCVFTLL